MGRTLLGVTSDRREPSDPLPTPELFSRTYLAVNASFAAVMFLTGFAALAVMPLLPETW